MANRLRWLIGVSAAFLAITLLISTSDFSIMGRTGRQYELSRTISRAREQVRDYTYVDSLMPLLPAQSGVHVALLGKVADSAAAAIHAAVASQVTEIDEARARVAVFVVPASMGNAAGSEDASPRQLYYAAVDQAGPYCFAVVTAPQRGDSLHMLARRPGLGVGRDSVRAPLGPCFYWARYGAPGQQLATWLREGGYRFADLRETRATRATRAPEQRELREVRVPRRRIFGLRDYSEQSLFGQTCQEGRTEQCVHALTSVRAAGRPAADRLAAFERGGNYYWGERAFGLMERALLADVERQFGAEKFAQFWRSDAAVETAFASAFGTPLGAWVQQWAIAHYGAQPARAGLDGWTLLLSLVVIGALCGAAFIEAQRRQVR